MGLIFYKPRQSGDGVLCNISFNSKEGSLYVKFVKQTGWDAEKKNGTFKGGESRSLKFSIVEIGGLIDAIERNVEFKGFHGVYGATQFYFNPYLKGDVQVGFVLKTVTTPKDQEKITLGIAFDFKETVTLREYFKFALEHCFSAIYSADKKAYEDSVKKKTVTPTKEKAKEAPPQEEEAGSDPWDFPDPQ